MKSRIRTFFGPALALGIAAVPLAAGAQVSATYQPAPPVLPAQPGSAELSRNLNILANNPNSVAALTGAGRAALELGDPEAALNFFGRAEEIEPQSGDIKARIGAALVQMDQPEPALRFFDEAVRLGAPEAELAGDRGLAFDLTGNPQRAQRDYQTALRRHENPEIRRRLALSLALSGQRAPAVAAIDAQLRQQDRAAWRTRAFILALTGDLEGANQAVQAAMPGQALALSPFLARLPSLTVAERARAVHLGLFPGEAPRPSNIALAPVPRAPVPVPSLPRVPDAVTAAGRPDPGQTPLGALPPPAAVSPSGPTPALPATRPPALANATPLAPAPVARPPAPRAAPTVKPAARSSGFSDIASVVADLRDPAPVKSPPTKPSAAKAVPAKPAAAKPATKAESSKPPKEPSRAWVQIAHAPTAGPLDDSYDRIKRKASKLLADRDAWISSDRKMARLLVGPFKSSKEAEQFADRLEKAEVTTLVWTSPAGQEVRKLSD